MKIGVIWCPVGNKIISTLESPCSTHITIKGIVSYLVWQPKKSLLKSNEIIRTALEMRVAGAAGAAGSAEAVVAAMAVATMGAAGATGAAWQQQV